MKEWNNIKVNKSIWNAINKVWLKQVNNIKALWEKCVITVYNT